jgi:hypothetical protein
MTGHGAKFGRKKEEAIAALMVQRNTEEAARAVGIAPKTLLRWLQIPEFQTALRDAKLAAFSQTTGRLHQMSSTAVSILGKVMVDPATPPATKIRAADSILNHTIKTIETENLEVRLSELERATEASGNKR